MSILNAIDKFMWGKYMMGLLYLTGIVLTVRYGGVQFRKIWLALKITFSRKSVKGGEEGDITPFQALMTTLAATVGNGNIAGVATAIALGGPGAIFWMWVTALFGMATRATEALLGVKFRKKAEDGTYIGGAFYYLEDGASKVIGRIPARVLAVGFAFAGMIAAFGIGNMVQSNSVTLSLSSILKAGSNPTFNAVAGVILAVLTGLVIIGGIKEIGKVTEKLVPFMAVVYITGALIVIIVNFSRIPEAISLIITGAFTGHAAVGGFAGATVAKTIQFGVARGIFSNEAGLGTGSLAHSAAQTSEPAKQGLVAMVGTFIDTIVICSLTGLAITLTGAWTTGATSTALTIKAFDSVIPTVGGLIVALSSMLFGYSTLIGWSYYGEQCTEYLFGVKSNVPYRLLFVVGVFVGAVAKLSFVWTLSDILNGFMAIPNLIGLLVLSGVASREMKEWLKNQKVKSNAGG